VKLCSVCGKSLPLEEFQRKSSAPAGRASACRRCDNARRVQRRIDKGLRRPDPAPGFKWCGRCGEEKPLGEFYHRQSGSHAGRPHAHCIPCFKADNIARARARGVEPKREADPFYARRKRLARYGLTLDAYDKLLADQGGVCLGCGMEPGARSFAVDHDHSCCAGEVTCGRCIRGLLCLGCNFAVGHAGDSSATLRRLATYLDAYVSPPPCDS
jgi:hypothetical protein